MENYDVLSGPATLIEIPDAKNDYVAWVTGGQLVDLWKSDAFVDTIRNRFSKVVSVSGEVISSLRRNLDFNGYYIAHILDQLSEEEFCRISEEYEVMLRSEETEELKEKIKILFGISRERFTASDLSNIFKIEEGVAEHILNDLREGGFITDSEG